MADRPGARALGWVALVAAVVASAPPAGAAAPSPLKVAYSEAAPFPVTALDAGATTTVLAGREGRVAVIRTSTGLLAWERRGGAAARVAFAGDVVALVAAARVDVYRRTVGTRAWGRALDCADAASCRERVVLADPSGVYVASGGRVQDAVMRYDAATGERRWSRPAAVDHPRRAIAGEGWVAFEEGNPPFALAFVDLHTGAVRGRWQPTYQGAPRPMPVLSADGARLVAADLRPLGALARVALVDERGGELVGTVLSRPAGADNDPITSVFMAQRWIGFVPDPAAGKGILAVADLTERDPLRSLPVDTFRAPLPRGSALVLWRGEASRAVVWAMDPASPARPLWTTKVPTSSEDPGVALAGRWLVVVDPTTPVRVTVVDADTGARGAALPLVAASQAQVSAAGAAGSGVVFALGGTVVGLMP